MAKVTFNRKELEKYFKIDEKILDQISMFGTTVESYNSEDIELEVPANRPDLLSLPLFAKAFKSFTGKQTPVEHKINHSQKSNYIVSVESSVKSIRPYTACAVVKSLELNEEKIKEIISLQEKLHSTIGRNRKKCAIGIYPLEKISFPIKYEALKPQDISFIPLGEKKPMSAMQILQKHAKGKEYAKLIEKYDKFPVFIDSKKRILSMPPIINSQETGQITKETKEVFVECSGYDYAMLKKVLAIITLTLAEMGGSIHSITLKDKETEILPDLKEQTIKISIDNVNKLLGLKLGEKDLSNLLKKMGHEYDKSKVSSPTYRVDILHEVDIIEDIAIAFGYENIEAEIPQISTVASIERKTGINTKIIEALVGLGFLETSSLHLITAEEARKANHNSKSLTVESSRTDYSILRPNLTIPILRTLGENTNAEYPQKICEIGKVFIKDNETETGIAEKDHLIMAICPGNFTESKQTLDHLTGQIGISYELKETESWPHIRGRAGNIIVNNKHIGTIGEVHPSTLQDWSIKLPLAIIEINLDEIYKIIKASTET